MSRFEAVEQGAKRILSIGCSCINRFQFEFFLERHPDKAQHFQRGLFDWNISSLVTTLDMLRRVSDGKLSGDIENPDNYRLDWERLILNDAWPGFLFYHEEEPAELLSDTERWSDFIGKVTHLAKPFVAPVSGVDTHLVWSNLQPNLPDAVENVIPWEAFVLTENRYQDVKSLCRVLFGNRTGFTFLSTPQDIDPKLVNKDDVRIIDLPRSEDYEGPHALYEDVLQGILDKSR